jgi:ribosomal protein L7/L12
MKNIKLLNFSPKYRILSFFPVNKFAASIPKGGIGKIREALRVESKEDKELRFEDETFYFNKNWNKLENLKHELYQGYPTSELTEYQQREVDTLVNKVSHMNSLEYDYFFYTLKDLIDKTIGIEKFKMNIMNPGKKINIDISNNHDDPNYIPTQQILGPLLPFLASGYFTGSSSIQPSSAPVKEEKVEKKPQKVAEKAQVDIKLMGFDPAKKIGLIKVVREMLTLGLKESKEMVEKAPVLLKNQIARQEANEIKKKLEENGGKVDLI